MARPESHTARLPLTTTTGATSSRPDPPRCRPRPGSVTTCRRRAPETWNWTQVAKTAARCACFVTTWQHQNRHPFPTQPGQRVVLLSENLRTAHTTQNGGAARTSAIHLSSLQCRAVQAPHREKKLTRLSRPRGEAQIAFKMTFAGGVAHHRQGSNPGSPWAIRCTIAPRAKMHRPTSTMRTHANSRAHSRAHTYVDAHRHQD